MKPNKKQKTSLEGGHVTNGGCEDMMTDALVKYFSVVTPLIMLYHAFQTKIWRSDLGKFRIVFVIVAEKCVSERFRVIGRRKISVQ